MTTTRAWSAAATFVLPPLLGAGWAVSLIASGDGAQVAQFFPAAILAMLVFAVFCWALVSLHKAAVILLLCSAVVLISITFRVRAPGEPGLDIQNGYKLAIWMLLLLAYVSNFRRTLRYYHDPVFFLFGCFCLCNFVSVLYSPVPLVSLAGALGTAAYFGFALVAVDVLGSRTTLLALMAAMFSYEVLNAFSPLYAPDAAYFLTDPSTGIYRFQGISGQPNSLSRQSIIFLIVIISARQQRYIARWLAVALGLGAFGLAIATEGRTAMLAFLLALVLQLPRQYLPPLLIAAVTAIVALWFTGVVDILLAMVGRGGSADEVLSLAGRTELWSFVWEQIVQHPIAGHGYNSFESYAAGHWVGVDKAIVVITHNLYLEVLYNTGVIGEIFFVTPFLILLRRWYSRPNLGRDIVVWALLIGGMTEVELTVAAILPPFMFFVMLAIDAKETFDA